MTASPEKFEVIVVGELNVDLILNQIATFPEIGKEILAKTMTLTLGSSAAIFASNLSSLGAKVAFLGKIGKDVFGSLVLESLEKKGVDTSLIIQSDSLNTGATVVLNFDQDRANITHAGAMDHLTIDDIGPDKFKGCKHLHFSSYFLQTGLKKDIARLFSEAKKAGLTTSFDVQWDPWEKWDLDLKNVLPYVDVFLPNEKELMKLTGRNTLESAIDSIKGFANTIVVKLGSKGSASYHKGQLVTIPAFINEQVVDAIGAGDSFNAGFVYKFIQGAPIETCQQYGNLMGAISTTAAGGTAAFTDKKNIMKNAKERFGFSE
ncbi:MAG TPA: carbohydrate kinase family protein [Flavitalea sp.]|nr:carbohydrate kinase family protein [Flavitalea sp.]